MKKAQSSNSDLTEVVKRLARVVERQQEEIERLNQQRPFVPYPVYPYYPQPWPWYQRPYITWQVPMSQTTVAPQGTTTTWSTSYINNPGNTTLTIGEGNA